MRQDGRLSGTFCDEAIRALILIAAQHRPKYACRSCETVHQVFMPSRPIERGRPGPELLAQVLVTKYDDHRVSWNTPSKGGVEAA